MTEQAFVDFIDILPSVDENTAVRALNTLLTLTRLGESGRVYHYFLTMSENYLYDPNSPLRNEELYSLVLDYVLRNTNDGILNVYVLCISWGRSRRPSGIYSFGFFVYVT